MKVEEIEQEALALSESQRASLIAKLIDTLPPASVEVSDAEVDRRDAGLETGEVAPMLHEEFVRRVQDERRR
jgi:hypothetical protein